MKILIVCDSVYGNTWKIAEAVAGAFSAPDEVKLVRSAEVNLEELESTGLLIVGSPTQGGRPIQPTKKFLDNIPKDALKNTGVAAFDTRISETDSGFWVRRILKFIGYAAGRIAKKLGRKGGRPVAPPEGFIVKDTEGPLKEGELERAAVWAEELRKKAI